MGEQLGGNPPPFLKWAGGKRWLVENHFDLINIEFDRYIEPFLGSGAVFFKLAPTSAILSDKNLQLIQVYEAIKQDWQMVYRHLAQHHCKHSRGHYYHVRSHRPRSLARRAAQFIYLNRTCWNGLYRVNLKGEFNVAKGTKSQVVLESDDFEATARLLSKVRLESEDFEEVLMEARKGDFIFVDPPYTVKHNNNAFIKYNQCLFSWEDQVRLAECVRAAKKRGAKLVVTNACHDSIRMLYRGIGEQIVLCRPSVISGDPSARGYCEELVVRCR